MFAIITIYSINKTVFTKTVYIYLKNFSIDLKKDLKKNKMKIVVVFKVTQ